MIPQICEGMDAMDFDRVQAWLAASYWTPGIGREQVERAALNSALVIGAFSPAGNQIGYARLVSDKTRFAYLCDVVVDEAHRGQGIGRMLVKFAVEHPEFATVTTWTLATRDAHGVYAALGFRPVSDPTSRPEIWMMMFRPTTAPKP